MTLSSKKMEHILDKIIIPSLRAGVIEKFQNFLEAMEDSEDTDLIIWRFADLLKIKFMSFKS